MKKFNLLFLILSVIFSIACYILYRIFDLFLILILGILFFIVGLFFLNRVQIERREKNKDIDIFKENYNKIVSNPSNIFEQIISDYDKKEVIDLICLEGFKQGGFIDCDCSLELIYKDKTILIKPNELLINNKSYNYKEFENKEDVYKKIREAN